MGGLCNGITDFAWLFLLFALFAAVAETAVAVFAKWRAIVTAPKSTGRDRGLSAEWGPVLEALAKVLAALKDLPAWVAIFLAGLALVWTAASAPHLCS